MVKGYRINYKNIIILFGIIILSIGILFFIFQALTSSHIVLVSKTQEVEINSQVDYKEFVKEVKDGKISDIKINSKNVKIGELGEYTVIFQYQDEKAEMKLKVVDTKAPRVQLKNLTIAQNQNIKAEDLVKKIVDETKTKVSFANHYDFSTVGQLQVQVVVQDEAGNRTTEKATIEVVKDEKAPVIVANSFSVKKGDKVDLLKYVTIRDDYDQNPKLVIEKNGFDVNKNGTYTIKYIATDFSGNKSEKEVKVFVKDKVVEKIVYLTFDDGPSANTQKILEILERYNAKATFFVTGTNQNYNYLIKEAHDKGHTIGLHTYCHDYKTVYSSVDAYFDDLTKVGNMVKDLIGYTPKYIRFPGGSSNTVSRKYVPGIMTTLSKEVINRGYQYYDWNGDSTDASGNNVPVNKLIANATSSKSNNINILFHDTSAKSTTVQALPAIIENYLARGYRFEAINDSSFAPHQGINN